ncbi:MAG: DUF3455 domain-containing protein [Betaproteobacteria bacterium]
MIEAGVRMRRTWILASLSSWIAGCGMLTVGEFPRAIIPAEIAAPANQYLEWVLVAKGVQIYRCDPKKDAPGQYDWAFQAPEAYLRDVPGKSVGRHYAGPTWETDDGSKVIGAVQARVDAPEKGAIPWLRLGAKSTGSAGSKLAKVTTVLRVSTNGGQPPPGCTEPDQGRILRVGYTADYYFYVNR